MSGIFGSISIAVRSLLAQEGALNTISNNVANANTPGYSRELPILTESPPQQIGQFSIGNGVTFEGVQSVRDNVLDLRIDQETQQQNQLQSYLNSMNQVQALFNDTAGSGLSDSINQFFSSFQQLADNPADIPTRNTVIAAGQDLAAAFQQTGQQLSGIQDGVDQEVSQTVSEINADTTQLANLNQIVATSPSNTDQAGTFEDQQSSIINSLSKLVDVAPTTMSNGSITLTTSSGVPLVAGSQSFALTTAPNATTGFQDIFSQGTDVTSQFAGGQLAGLLQARDQTIPSALSSLDNLAAGIINAVNNQNKEGADLNGKTGGDFFQPVVQPSPGSNAGASESMAVAITDPSLIAAATDGSKGGNANALAMANLQNAAIVNGDTATNYYSDLVSSVGNDVSTATNEQEAVGLVLTQLQNQQSNISGVSLDEEAANLIQYQQAYEAAAQIVSTLDQLTNTVIQEL